MAQTETVKESKKNKGIKGRKNGVAGFYIDKIDGDTMREFVAAKKLDIDVDELSDEQIAVSLFTHFTENTSDEEQVKCDNCLGVSSDDLKACPYCGDEGEVEDEEEETKASDEEVEEESEDSSEEEDESEDEEEETKDSSDDEDEEESEDEDDSSDDEEEDESEDEEEETKDSSDDEDEEESEEKVAAAAPETKKRGRPKGSKNKSKEEPPKKAAAAKHVNGASKKSTALTKATSTEVEKSGEVTIKDLDKAVSEVIRLRSAGAENYWHIGKKLEEINRKQLWKLRTNPDSGKRIYNSFDAFVSEELHMSREHAYNAIEVAKNYKDVEEVRQLGHTKAALILKAPPKAREELKLKAKAGATKRELVKDVKDARQKHGAAKTGKKAEAGAKGGAARAKKMESRSEKISIATIEGTTTIPLFKKPETLRGFNPAKAEAATSIKDGPFGFRELTNGVVEYFHLFLKDGVLKMKIQTIRAKAED